MSCLPGMPCYNNFPDQTLCKSSDTITYTGDNLPCSGIQTGDTLTESIQKLDQKMCSSELAGQIIQQINDDPTLKFYFCQLVSECTP